MKYLFLLLTITSLVNVSAQNKSCVIIDSVSKKAIAYPNIFFQKDKSVKTGNAKGSFQFSKPQKVKITCPTYQTKSVKIASSIDTILLSPSISKRQLQTNNRLTQTKKHGFQNAANTSLPARSIRYYKKNSSGFYLKNPKPSTKTVISSVIADLKTLSPTENKIRIHFNKFNPKKNIIGEAIGTNNQIFTVTAEDSLKQFNLKQPFLFPKSGVLITFEALEDAKNLSLRVGFNSKNNYQTIYEHFTEKNRPELIGKLNYQKAIPNNPKNQYVPKIGVSISKFKTKAQKQKLKLKTDEF